MAYSDEQVARVCHEANRALQRVQEDPAPSRSWLFCPADIREGVAEGVRAARSGTTPRGLWESWKQGKLALGWTYGPEKDPVKKTHPCLTENYEDLPQGQRDKDQLFLLIVMALTVGTLPDAAVRGYQEHGQHTAGST